MSPATRNLAFTVFFLAGAGVATLVARQIGPEKSHPPLPPPGGTAKTAARASVAALGRLNPAGGIINVGGTAGERVERITVVEGDAVEAGQELAYLASYPLRESELHLAEIQLAEGRARQQADQAYGTAIVAEAEAAMDQLKLADLDVDALRAKISSLELHLKIATRDFERVSAAGEAISSQEVDHQQLLVEQAKAELISTQKQLTRLEASRIGHEREAQAKLATAKANQQRLQATVQLESLEKARTAAEQKVELSVVRAPRAGRVLRILTAAGETVGPRPILQIGDTDEMFVIAEIYETDVRFVRKGQRATITSDALSAPLGGTVESVGNTVAKNEVASLDPTASSDARVVLAKIRLDKSPEAAAYVDLQVDVHIDVAQQASADTPSREDRGG